MIGCHCAVCRSDDPRDTRTRPSILVTLPGGTVLVDTATDLRAQALRFGIEQVDALLFTHSHADHIFGLDETRRFNILSGRPLPLYADERTLGDLRRVFSYALSARPTEGGGVPALTPFRIAGPFTLFGQQVVPVPILHGRRSILGFRMGAFAYLTDCNAIPDESFSLLTGLDVLVLDALRYRKHSTHFTVEEAVSTAARIGARQTYLTHLCHDLRHATLLDELPPDVAPAYDGLVIDLPDGAR